MEKCRIQITIIQRKLKIKEHKRKLYNANRKLLNSNVILYNTNRKDRMLQRLKCHTR